MRETNVCADWMANWSLSQDFGVHEWMNIPLDLVCLVAVDAVGITNPCKF